jgi:hypothetical protein
MRKGEYMVRVAAIGGYQAKVALVRGKEGALALDGVERDGEDWRPIPVELSPEAAAALQETLDALVPTPSALHLLLAESLPPKTR